nr:MAG TPA: hypothetical protein [Caudoviricetes sp.]
MRNHRMIRSILKFLVNFSRQIFKVILILLM